MKKVRFLFWMVLGSLLMLPLKSKSQSCPNLNFNYGNLTHWQCYMGSCSGSSYNINATAQIPGRVDIMSAELLQQSGQFYDEKCNLIPKVPDGHKFSCRVGNSGTGAQVDGIEYEMRIDSTNSLLMLSFAWVMEQPGHPLGQQPQFTMEVRDSTGRVIDPKILQCSKVFFEAYAGMLGLVCDGSVQARPWTTVGFSLEPLMGQRIRIYFEQWDCTQSGHFGYSYIVGECRPMRIELAYCDGADVARMTAPEGFDSYEWRRSSNSSWSSDRQQINIQKPMDGEIFTVTVKSEIGCESQLKTEIKKTMVTADFIYGVMGAHNNPGDVCIRCNNNLNWYDTCTRTATFVDKSSVYNSTKNRITWQIHGLPVINHDSMFTYTFPPNFTNSPITYLVRLQVEAENGCADTSKPIGHEITIYPSPQVMIEGPDQLCEGKTAYLNAKVLRSNFVSHQWTWTKTNGQTGSLIGDTLEINGPGIYCLTSQDDNECYAYDTLTVTPLKPEIKNLETRPVDCFGNATGQFSHGEITGGALGGFQMAQWTIWDDNEKIFKDTNIIDRLGRPIIFRNQIAGDYHFFGIDAEGCPIQATITIQQPDSLRLFPTPKKTVCYEPNGAITLYANGGISPYTISITGPDSRSRSGLRIKDTITYKDLPEGIYIASVTDSNNCETGNILVEIEQTPYPILIVDTIITAKCGENNGEIALMTQYAPGPPSYKWTPDTNSLGKKIESNRINALSPGIYVLHFEDANGCKINTSYTVDSFPPLTLTYVVRSETCGRKDGEITLTVISGSPDSIAYVWDGLPDITNVITGLEAGTYSVVVTDSFCEISATIDVPHIDGPIANFEANTYTVPVNVIFTLTDDSYSKPNAVPFTWIWDMGDGKEMQGRVVRYSYGATGDYIVFMEVADTNACTDTISKIIHVYDELHVYIPNTFTPNNDKLNDTWKPIILENSDEGYLLTVYDRWGQRVFHTTDPKIGWDGTIRGKAVQNNTIYSYRLVVRDFTGQEFEYVGHVTILR